MKKPSYKNRAEPGCTRVFTSPLGRVLATVLVKRAHERVGFRFAQASVTYSSIQACSYRQSEVCNIVVAAAFDRVQLRQFRSTRLFWDAITIEHLVGVDI
jgi:hypothetical protein